MSFYDDAKRWWRSKTLAFGGSLTVVGQVLDQLKDTSEQWASYLGRWGGMAITAIGVAVIVLRFKTKKAVRVRKPAIDETDEAGA